jgi:ribonuclease HI
MWGFKCGAGAILKCPDLGVFSLKMNCGPGTNTRGELLALWSILFFAQYKQISCLQLVGDSKVIVDWFSFKNNLQVINLQPWMSKIRQMSEKFQNLKVQHIYREYNKEVDQLSKQALQLEEGVLFYAKGIGIHTDHFERMTII